MTKEEFEVQLKEAHKHACTAFRILVESTIRSGNDQAPLRDGFGELMRDPADALLHAIELTAQEHGFKVGRWS
jgi:hypothetical protein